MYSTESNGDDCWAGVCESDSTAFCAVACRMEFIRARLLRAQKRLRGARWSTEKKYAQELNCLKYVTLLCI